MHARRYVLAVLSAISFAGAVVVAPAASAVTVNLYVATAGNGGSNSNDCSQTHPCLTIAYAISQGTPTGTTVHVGAGSFAENVSPGATTSVAVQGNGQSGPNATVIDPSSGGALGATAGKTLTVSALRVDTAPVGALANGGTLDISDVTFHAVPCAVYAPAGTADLTGSTIDHSDTGSGGCFAVNVPGNHDAVYVGGATVSFHHSSLTDFNPGTTTGVEVASGAFSAADSVFSDAYYFSQSVANPAIKVEGGTATIDRSLLYADHLGLISSGGAATLSDSTIIGAAFGVGSTGGSGPTLVRSTIEEATVTGAITLAASVLDAGSSGNCSSATITDLGYNLSSDATCNLTDTHSRNNVANLHIDNTSTADNGGPTQTATVTSPSPLIDSIPAGATYGNSQTPLCTGTTDQRGLARPQGSACDAGAFEVASTTTALAAAPNPAAPGSNVTLTARVARHTGAFSDPDPVAGTVTFKRGTTTLCSNRPVANGQATCTTNKLPAGRDTVSATFTSSSPYLNSSGTRSVVVGTMPKFTSPNTGKATIGARKTISIHASGTPTPTITKTSGALPRGMHFTGGAGTATISGTPAAGTAKKYLLHLRASNVRGSATQTFTLTVVRG